MTEFNVFKRHLDLLMQYLEVWEVTWFAFQGDFSTTTHFCTNQNPIVEMKNRTEKTLKL